VEGLELLEGRTWDELADPEIDRAQEKQRSGDAGHTG
jgi:hypothetical protein